MASHRRCIFFPGNPVTRPVLTGRSRRVMLRSRCDAALPLRCCRWAVGLRRIAALRSLLLLAEFPRAEEKLEKSLRQIEASEKDVRGLGREGGW